MTITEPLVLPTDVVLVPVDQLPAQMRDQMHYDEGDYAIARPHSRAASSIIDAQAAELLNTFRSPRTIVDAVLSYSRERQMDPEETLVEAYPLIKRLLSSKLLVLANSDEANEITSTFEIGERVGDFEVVKCVQVLEDTELYQVRLPGGEQAALKIVRQGYTAQVQAAFDREAAILKHLQGTIAPALLLQGEIEGRSYLAIQWFPGVTVWQAAEEARALPGWQGRKKLLTLCTSVLKGYADLHSRGLIHSDVHPRNVLVGEDGSVKIIDFGLTQYEGNDHSILSGTLASSERGGVGFFFEPEYAEIAIGARGGPPSSTMLGEQYSLAALLYLLFTGVHYVDFSLEREEMLRQIAQEKPAPFARRGVPSWASVERVLAKAMSKDPAGRYPSLGEFHASLEEVALAIKDDASVTPPNRSNRSGECSPDDLLEEMLHRFSLEGPLLEGDMRTAPTCSITYGMAGVAYAIYRVASIRSDPALLALADVWSSRAASETSNPEAFYNPDIEITPEVVGQTSPYHTASGVHAVQALVAHARGDILSQYGALQKFLNASEGPSNGPDLTLGTSGTILAISMLLDTMGLPERGVPKRVSGASAIEGTPGSTDGIQPGAAAGTGALYPDSSPLIEAGEKRLVDLWKQLGTYAPITECREINYLGIAHGWAGLAYTALRWCKAAGSVLPSGVEERIDQLAQLAEEHGSGARWPWALDHSAGRKGKGRSSGYMSGWCNGSAGYVFLWTLAHKTFGDERYLALAEKAAWNAWEEPDGVGQICCGLAGRAYALLNLYKHTGEGIWVERAQSLTARAAIIVRSQSMGPDSMQDSLYKGDIGVALLAADLTSPDTACMPFFEEEGWA